MKSFSRQSDLCAVYLICLFPLLSFIRVDAQTGEANNPCPANVLYSCKSFAEKSAIARDFINEYEQKRDFSTVAPGEGYPQSKRANEALATIEKAQRTVQSATDDAIKDPSLREQALELYFELFHAIDEGRITDRWERLCWASLGPYDQHDPQQLAAHEAAMKQNDAGCAAKNFYVRLQTIDYSTTVSFSFTFLGNGIYRKNERNIFIKLLRTSSLSTLRQNALIEVFDHAYSESNWKPPDIYAPHEDSQQNSVDSFNVDNVTRIVAALMLAKQQQIPLGIEYAGTKMFEKVTIHVVSTNINKMVNEIFPVSGGFQISTQDGVLVISHQTVPESRVNILDTELTQFSIPKCSLPEAYVMLDAHLARELWPLDTLGSAGSVIESVEEVQIGPFELTHVTVREALNRIVRERGGAAWIVEVKPEMLARPTGANLEKRIMEGQLSVWTVVEYDNISIQNIGLIIQHHALGH